MGKIQIVFSVKNISARSYGCF